ncbi:MAG: hypothetical protein U5J63_03970 [Fodinibius sp.]|nr:hypothetical protein [Fodinibius sp.]
MAARTGLPMVSWKMSSYSIITYQFPLGIEAVMLYMSYAYCSGGFHVSHSITAEIEARLAELAAEDRAMKTFDAREAILEHLDDTGR